MPNAAKDSHDTIRRKILALGQTGAGKTTQFLTLPGRKFMYLFDPNAILSIQGYDVDYEEFIATGMNLDVRSLTKENNARAARVMKSVSADTYIRWEQDFENKISSGFFDDYEWLAFDSFTTLSSMVMDQILKLNGRPDSWPQQDDYGPQMLTLTNIMRQACSLPCGVYVTGHIETRQDKMTKKINTQPMMTGRLPQQLPLLFSDVLLFETQPTQTGTSYMMQTKPDADFKTVRTAMHGLEIFEDVTLDLTKPLLGQGLGGVMKWAEKNRIAN